MTQVFKPMLAATITETAALPFPLLISPKLDGIRCIVRDGVAYSRSNKPIRNRHIQLQVATHADVLDGLDGELVVGSPTAPDVYRVTNSAVMSIEGEPEFKFYVFDDIRRRSAPFEPTYHGMQHRGFPTFVEVLAHQTVSSEPDLLSWERAYLDQGYEGVMLRLPDGPYKMNRSTLKEGYLMKLKRFTDAEAECIGFGELMHNQNEAVVNELGHTSRSAAADGLVPGNTLGYLLCRTGEGVEFKIGTGFTTADRSELWAKRGTLPGLIVKFKSFEIGVKEAPRHPVWLGFRDPSDM